MNIDFDEERRAGGEPMAKRDLTGLECVVLAQVWRLGDCTAHQVRRSFANSTSGKYSDSAGSIYPILKRLKAAQFLSAREDFNGAQRRIFYRCKSAGERRLKRWLFEMNAKNMFADDPLRTRLIYLDALDEKSQRDWLAEAERALGAQADAFEDEYADISKGDLINRLILKGLRETSDLRLGWIADIRGTLRRKGRLSIGAQAKSNLGDYRPISGTGPRKSTRRVR